MNTDKPLIVSRDTLGCDSYQGTNEESELLLLALQNYGFLLKASNPDLKVYRYSFGQFADLIEVNYDRETLQTDEIVKALRKLHERNS